MLTVRSAKAEVTLSLSNDLGDPGEGRLEIGEAAPMDEEVGEVTAEVLVVLPAFFLVAFLDVSSVSGWTVSLLGEEAVLRVTLCHAR